MRLIKGGDPLARQNAVWHPCLSHSKGQYVPIFGWEWDEDDHKGQNTQLHVPSPMFLIGPTLARFKLLAIHLLSSVGLPFIYQFHPLSDHQPRKRTRGKSRRHEKETNNTDYERTTDHGGERGDTCLEIRFRMHPSLFVCASLRPCHPLSIAYAPYCPFVSVQCIQTNTHKADYRLEVKDRER